MPVRPNIENASIPLMRKHEIFVDGYPLALVQTFTDDLVSNQETFDVFGYDQQMFYNILDGGSLSMEFINDDVQKVMFDLATGQKPDNNAAKTYRPQETIRLSVLRNELTEDGTGYKAVDYWGNWTAVFRTPAGGPRDRGVVTVDGRCKTPVRVAAPVNTKIAGTFDVVALARVASPASGTAQLNLTTAAGAATLVGIPAQRNFRNAVTYALAVEVHCCDAVDDHTNINLTRQLPVTATMVLNSGLLTITDEELAPLGLTTDPTGIAAGNKTIVTHAFVTYIVQPPSGTADGSQGGRCLLGDGISYEAKYD